MRTSGHMQEKMLKESSSVLHTEVHASKKELHEPPPQPELHMKINSLKVSKRLLNKAIMPLNIKIKNKSSNKIREACKNIYQQINMNFLADLKDNKSRTTLKNTSHSQANYKTHNKTPGDFISYDSNSILQDLKIFDQIT